MKYSAYIICNNSTNPIAQSIDSLKRQIIKPIRILIIDDGCEVPLKKVLASEKKGITIIQNEKCMGRGFSRNLAFQILNEKYIFSLDSTNIVPEDYMLDLSKNLIDSSVVGVFGLIKNHASLMGSAYRWRARHLFREKEDYGKVPSETLNLSTYATMLSRKHVLEVGNFNKELKHSEDDDLALRLSKKKYKIVGDPNLVTYSIKKESILSVLERYWRWNAQSNMGISLISYLKMIHFSLKVMAYKDLKQKEFLVSLYSLLSPHYYFLKCATDYIKSKNRDKKRR